MAGIIAVYVRLALSVPIQSSESVVQGLVVSVLITGGRAFDELKLVRPRRSDLSHSITR